MIIRRHSLLGRLVTLIPRRFLYIRACRIGSDTANYVLLTLNP